MSKHRKPKTHKERALQGEDFLFDDGKDETGAQKVLHREYVPTFRKTATGFELCEPTMIETRYALPLEWG